MTASSQKRAPISDLRLEEYFAARRGLLHPQDTVATAGKKMRSLDADALPVTEDSRLVGLLDQPDPERKVASHGHDPDDIKVGETMNRDLAFCFADESCRDALRVMEERGLSKLPIVDRSMRVLGTVDRSEIENAREGTAE